MSAEQFRRLGREMVDRVAAYMETVEQSPVLSASRPGQTLDQLPRSAPEHGEAWPDILADIDRVIMPGLTHWQHPSFFGFFPANTSGPSILADLLCAGLGVQGMLWATSPACTELETRVCDWMAELLGLPESMRSTASSGGGVIQGTASESTLVALVAARHRVQRRAGRDVRPVLYASTQAHSSVVKAAMIAGLADGPEDRRFVRLIGTRDDLSMDAAQLHRAVDADVAAGLSPAIVVATVGTTSSTAIDRLDDIAPIARAAGAWLHVDAAYSGAACICPEQRERHWGSGPGLASVDSLAINPHKWLLTGFDCNLTWTSDRSSWTGALSVTPEYLRNAASTSGSVIDYRDWQVPLGRRFRALKLWFVIRHYGAAGLRAYIRDHIRLAGVFEELVRTDDRFEIAAERTSGLVCFRLRPLPGEPAPDTDARNKALLDRVSATGRAYLTHTVLPATGASPLPRLVLRLALGATGVQERHVRLAWDVLRDAAG
jgi:aromatic-L-amino-acid decarboxylase